MKDERDLTGTLHPEATGHDDGVQRMLQQFESGTVTVEEAMEALGMHELDRDPPPSRLSELAKLHGTDKGPAEHNYTPLYDDHFWLHRYEALTLLELGIYRGASLRMWRDYFPNATIIGLDRNNTADLSGSDTVGLQGDQCDENVINQIGSLYGPLHIVIDDASHISSKTIRSFELLWPHLAPGGIYVIEDLQTSYDPANYGISEANENPNCRPDGVRQSAMQFCRRLADEVNHGLYPEKYWLGYDVASVEFHLNICFITKAGDWAAG